MKSVKGNEFHRSSDLVKMSLVEIIPAATRELCRLMHSSRELAPPASYQETFPFMVRAAVQGQTQNEISAAKMVFLEKKKGNECEKM